MPSCVASRAKTPTTARLSAADAFASFARPALVNGGAGVVVGRAGAPPFAVVSFTVSGGRIAAIDLITDREKLSRMY